jgi:predicted Zn-dependent protease
MKKLYTTFLIITILFLSACDKNNDFVIFSVENDKELGAQVAAEIANNPAEFPILDPVKYSAAYDYLDGIMSDILQSDAVTYKDEFPWELKIIHNDEILNAFATPGGYIYVYTGLIKYLDKEDDLAGVLGHEIAHADQRHSTKQLQKRYGIQILLNVILGQNPSTLGEIAGAIAGTAAGLQFSREYESEADDYSVEYLSDTPYQCNGAYSFFQKLLDTQQTSGVPEFLSTHPNPENRVDDINAKASELGCSTNPWNPSSYHQFKSLLP